MDISLSVLMTINIFMLILTKRKFILEEKMMLALQELDSLIFLYFWGDLNYETCGCGRTKNERASFTFIAENWNQIK